MTNVTRLTRAVLLASALLGACARSDVAIPSDESRDTATIAGARAERGVSTRKADDPPPAQERDWPQIAARDTLVVAAPYNSTTYFIYKGEPLGYEYELLKRFAAEKGLALQLVVVQTRDSLMQMLRTGRVDLVAGRLVPVPEDSGKVSYTHELYRTDPVLVQRTGPPQVAAKALPKPVDTVLKRGPAEKAPAPVKIHARMVQHPTELAGKRVTLPEDSPYQGVLLELSDEISGDIDVVELEASDEAVIREVSKGNVAYTVAEGNLAQLQGGYYRNLAIRPVVGPPKKVAWAVRRDARVLLDTMNAWLDDEKTTGTFNALYKKYFVDQRGYHNRVASRYLTSATGTLSPYDSLLKLHAARLGWDWRLLGSQMYQESKFNPQAKSWVGARGLMQLMPATARQFGVRSMTDPRQNVAGGVAYLLWLERYWKPKIQDPGQRLRFVLASYNAGIGHVADAQRLAEKHDDDPKRWKDVAYWMLQLSKSEFYADSVVQYGFCRGLEPVTYVSLILDRFQHYKQFVVKTPPADTAAPAPAARDTTPGRKRRRR